MTTTIAATAQTNTTVTTIKKGILAGLAGGIVFGMMMQMMGMMPMIASMFGSKSDVVGWMVHLMISAIFGLMYGAFAFRISGSWVISGIVYGIILWVIGPLLMMPMMMGMPLFTFGSNTWMSLMGHVIFGLITAGVFRKLHS